MRAADAARATCAAATDHGRPIVTIAGVHLIDVRRDFPDVGAWRPQDPAALTDITHHHDAVFYPVDPLPGDDFPAEMERLRAVWRYHIDRQGWPGIAYHTYGFPSGRLYLVGELRTQRAVVAHRNHQVRGHCSAGHFDTAPPPLGTQLVAGLATIAHWGDARRLIHIASHRDAANAIADPVKRRDAASGCPGATQDQWVPKLPQMIMAIAPQLRA